MTKLDKLPPKAVLMRFRGKIQVVYDRGIIVAKRWPRKRKGPLPPAVIDNNNNFKRLVAALKDITPQDKTASLILAHGTGYAWRDVMSRAMVGRLVVADWEYWARELGMDVQAVLDQLTALGPAIVFKTTNLWVAVPIGGPGQALAVDETGQGLEWLDLPEQGITELVGDIEAGPGSGTVEALLTSTGVVPDTYELATITVDAAGRITDAASGSVTAPSPPYQPSFVAGRYYGAPTSGNTSVGVATANTLYALPFYVGESTTFTKMAAFVAINAASTLELGIYHDSDGLPGSLAHDFGSVAVGAGTGKREITGQTLILTPGWYWRVMAASVNINMRTTASTDTTMSGIIGQADTLVNSGSAQGYTGSWTFSAGNLPSTFPTPSLTYGATPIAYIGL